MTISGTMAPATDVDKENANNSAQPAALLGKTSDTTTGAAIGGSTNSKRKCASCQRPKNRDQYSKSQWKKSADSRKCKSCVETAPPPLAVAANASTAAVAPTAVTGKGQDTTSKKEEAVGNPKTNLAGNVAKEEGTPEPTTRAPPKKRGGAAAASTKATDADAKKKKSGGATAAIVSTGQRMDAERLAAALSFQPLEPITDSTADDVGHHRNTPDGSSGEEFEDDDAVNLNFTYEDAANLDFGGNDATLSSVFGMALYEAEVMLDHVRTLAGRMNEDDASADVDAGVNNIAAKDILRACEDVLNLPCFKPDILSEMSTSAASSSTDGSQRQWQVASIGGVYDPSGTAYLYYQLVCYASRAEVRLGRAEAALGRVESALRPSQERQQQQELKHEEGEDQEFGLPLPLTSMSCLVELGTVSVEAMSALGQPEKAVRVGEFLADCIEMERDGRVASMGRGGLEDMSLDLWRLCAVNEEEVEEEEKKEEDEEEGIVPSDGEEEEKVGVLEEDADEIVRSTELVDANDNEEENDEKGGEESNDNEDEATVVSVMLDDDIGPDSKDDESDDAPTAPEIHASEKETPPRSSVIVAEHCNAEATTSLGDSPPDGSALYEGVLASLQPTTQPKPPDVTQTIYHAYKSAYGAGKSVVILGPLLGLTECVASTVISVGTLGNFALTDVDEGVVTPQLRGIDEFVLNPVISAVGGAVLPAVHKGEEVIGLVVHGVTSIVLGPFGLLKKRE